MPRMSTFMLTFRPPRVDFWVTLTDSEKSLVEGHFLYLAELHERGKVQFAGRSDDQQFGVALVEVASEEEARGILEGSPAVVAGMYSGELRRLRM
jgi:uncharacterized protein YciI